jgi:aspartyl-tRNA(Asn)/glutamyl-tRNA(Gln) amidotransferase subunit A
MTADLAMMPAHQLVKLYKARKASPVEAAKAAIARIEAFNPKLNAFQHLDPDGALRRHAPPRSAGRRAASGSATSTACRSPSRTWC